jgi:hypothetical protein
MAGKFHLGWFLNFVADEWNGNWGDGGRDFTGDFYVEMAKDLERVKFDYVTDDLPAGLPHRGLE